MAAEALPTTKRIELFSAKEFAMAALGNNVKSLCGSVLKAKNVPVTIPAEYLDYSNVFLPDFVAELPKRTGINDNPIEITFQVARRCSNIIHP